MAAVLAKKQKLNFKMFFFRLRLQKVQNLKRSIKLTKCFTFLINLVLLILEVFVCLLLPEFPSIQLYYDLSEKITPDTFFLNCQLPIQGYLAATFYVGHQLVKEKITFSMRHTKFA